MPQNPSSIALTGNNWVLSSVNASDGIAVGACLIHCMISEVIKQPATMSQALSEIRHRLNISPDAPDHRCVVLDGANGTELQRRVADSYRLSDDTHWGFDVLHSRPDVVRDVHRAYAHAGCHVLTTNTYSILEAPGYASDANHTHPDPAHWMDLARRSVSLAREAITGSGRENEVAVAFSIGGDIRGQEDVETIELLLRAFDSNPPDLILFETLSMIGDNVTMPVIEALIAEGWPVWVSFRRCRQGACGIHGQLWGGPEGDRFGRLARDLEEIGCEALLINCLPMARIGDTISWLSDFTDLPLGVYPNLGRAVEGGWQHAGGDAGDRFLADAFEWRSQGASIIGGCCGVGPEEIRRLATELANPASHYGQRKADANMLSNVHSPAGRSRETVQTTQGRTAATADRNSTLHTEKISGWQDAIGRDLFPLPLPKMQVEKGVFMPTQGSYLIWKFLFREGIGNNKRCLDIGCGAGILSVQLALNGAEQVTAIDIDEASVNNTLVNAYRNDVAARVTGLTRDLYLYQPDKRFDVIVASLYQMPTDPAGQHSGHRDVDYWGRNLLDHFISQLPLLLESNGVAYVMQVSMLGAEQTTSLLAEHGYQCRVIDFNLYQFNPVFADNLDQIRMVESLSDAYHFDLGRNEHVMVMYLLEIRAVNAGS